MGLVSFGPGDETLPRCVKILRKVVVIADWVISVTWTVVNSFLIEHVAGMGLINWRRWQMVEPSLGLVSHTQRYSLNIASYRTITIKKHF